MKYIIKFTKTGRMAYISHLDLIRLWTRALRVCGLRPLYSQGFNPHPKLSLAAPLPLGYESESEYLEFEIGMKTDEASSKERLNAYLPDGIRLLSLVTKPRDIEKTLAANIRSFTYEMVSAGTGADDEEAQIESFSGQTSIIVSKENRKKKITEKIDIAPYLISFRLMRAWGKRAQYEICIKADGQLQPNPLMYLNAYLEAFGAHADPEKTKIVRTEIGFS